MGSERNAPAATAELAAIPAPQPYMCSDRIGERAASKPARRRTAPLARTLRTRWWPRFLLAGVLLIIISATVLTGSAAAWVGISGAAVISVAVFRGATMTPDDYRREPPVPPGGGGGP